MRRPLNWSDDYHSSLNSCCAVTVNLHIALHLGPLSRMDFWPGCISYGKDRRSSSFEQCIIMVLAVDERAVLTMKQPLHAFFSFSTEFDAVKSHIKNKLTRDNFISTTMFGSEFNHTALSCLWCLGTIRLQWSGVFGMWWVMPFQWFNHAIFLKICISPDVAGATSAWHQVSIGFVLNLWHEHKWKQ